MARHLRLRDALSLILVGTAGLALAACADLNPPPAGDDTVATQTEAVVGGTETSAWPAVGALVVDYGTEIQHFCTATLIDDNWLVTAAHCVLVDGIEPYMVSFATCADARTTSTCPASSRYTAAAFYPHERYDPDAYSNDIALIQLADSVTGVTPMSLRTSPASVGTTLTWVGYGLNDGRRETGAAVKRQGAGRIDELYSLQYVYDNSEGAMPCSGDSGGPAFDSSNNIAGIVSAGDQYCESYGTDTRVDAFVSWINTTMSGEVWEPCSLLGGTCDAGQVCAPVDPLTCLPAGGEATGASCNADSATWAERWPCRDGAICLGISDTDDTAGQCFNFCQTSGDCASGEECTDSIFDPAAGLDYGVCIPQAVECGWADESCPADMGCFPTQDGGFNCYGSDGIPAGSACNADMESWTTLPCEDGAICLQVSDVVTDGYCFENCTNDSECAADETCYDIFTDLTGVGVCLCRDNDEDGVCQSDDCDDNDPTVGTDCGGTCTDNDGDGYGPGCAAGADCNDGNGSVNPGAVEACGDGVDNNCNGVIDEGCSGCTDNDGDGYCTDTDCNDGNASINPGTAEMCGDSVDNNCNGSVDEGCAGCTDADADGYCAESDCNDNNASANPGAAEWCGDGIDNNCDGVADEGCSGCTDADGDGYCESMDCNDQAAAIHPGGVEVCDGIDNNCDAVIDEGCSDGREPDVNTGDTSDGTTSSGCAVAPTTVPAWPGVLLVGLIAIRRRRRA